MALDTRNRRASALGFSYPPAAVWPDPDGDLANRADRQHIVYVYAGIPGDTVLGTGALLLNALTVSATGTHPFTGTAAALLNALTVTSSGTSTVNVTGTAAALLNALTVTSSGTSILNATGTAAALLNALTVTATGTSIATGTVTGTAALLLNRLLLESGGRIGTVGVTLLNSLTDDLDNAFFGAANACDFTETLTLGAQTAPCIFDSPSTGGDEKNAPWCWMFDNDITAIGLETADSVSIRGITYIVAGVQPDGTGVSHVILYENLT